jgi:hypothetical protein
VIGVSTWGARWGIVIIAGECDSPLRRDDGDDNGMVCDDDRRGEAFAFVWLYLA